jgi:UDP-glucose 4-epimerase
MNIFITGIAGFIGSSLAKRLKEKKHKVFGIDNLFSGSEKNIPKNIKWQKMDIRYKEDFKKIPKNFEAIIHTAAQPSAAKSFLMPLYDQETNVNGTYNVYKFAKNCRAKLMINLSSMAVYGSPKKTRIINENYEPRPVSLYGNSKLCAEKMLEILSKHDKIPVINLRLFNVYGPGQNINELDQGMASIYLHYLLYKKKILVKGTLDRVRDFIYIDDVVEAIVLVINSNLYKSNTFNISSKSTTSVKNLIKLLETIVQKKKKIIFGKATPGDIFGFGGNNDKFKKTYKWKTKFDLRRGLKIMSNYYQT